MERHLKGLTSIHHTLTDIDECFLQEFEAICQIVFLIRLEKTQEQFLVESLEDDLEDTSRKLHRLINGVQFLMASHLI